MTLIERWKLKIVPLLRKSERFTKTDMVYLAGGGFWLTLGQIVSSAATFGLAIAFANFLPKEVYGFYKFVLSIAGLLSIFTLHGMMSSVTQAVSRGFDGSVLPALRTRLRWGMLGGLAALGTAGYYFVNGNPTLTISFFIVAAFLPVMDAFGIFDALLNGKKRFRELATYNLWQKVVSTAILVVVVFLTNNLFLVLLAYFIPYTLLRYYFLRRSLKKFAENNKKDPASLSYGKHLSFMSVLATAAGQLDKVLIFHFLGAAELAVYAFALAPPEQIKGPLKGITALMLPKYSARDTEEIREGIGNKVFKFFLFHAALVVIYILAAPFLFQVFFPQYMDSVFLSQIFSLSLLANSFIPIGVFFTAKKKVKEQYIGNIVIPIFQMVITIALIIPLGLLGLIIARVLHRFFGSLFGLYMFRRMAKNE